MQTGLFFGLTTVDIIQGTSRVPGPNEKLRADWQVVCAGGPAANAAVAFGALGHRSRLCSALGGHPLATLAREDLTAHGVALEDCRDPGEGMPAVSCIRVDGGNGDRSVVYSTPVQSELRHDYPYEKLLDGVSVLLLDGHFPEQAGRLAREATRRGITVVLDGGSWKAGFTELLSMADYAICSADFRPPGCSDLEEVMAFLGRFSLQGYGVSRGALPLLAAENGEVRLIPVVETEVADTLGAGDILHGAFCAGIVSGGFEESLRLAVRTATRSCAYHGPRGWIATREGGCSDRLER